MKKHALVILVLGLASTFLALLPSGCGRSTVCWTTARLGSEPVSVRSGRLDREQPRA